LSQTERLIIFTRYPQPGRAKTRLIPALGAEGASALQRQMTEHTLRQVECLRALKHSHSGQFSELSFDRPSLSVEIWFAGTDAPNLDRQRMQDWLGQQWEYRSQPMGDLGDRMAQAFQAAFAQGQERVVTIGTDCPGLDASRMAQAFQLLQNHNLVLGPATDGGYYLIGLSRFVPELFTGIAWSTATVFQQTVTIAEQLGLSIAYLDELTDVDRPEDLSAWEKVCHASAPSLSVIIPVLNEANIIRSVLQNVWQSAWQNRQDLGQQKDFGSEIEVIVVDGGSHDETVELAKAAGATVISCATGRACQMNAGAAIAKGEILLFLHADTRLPTAAFPFIRQTLAKPRVVAGAFRLQIDGSEPGLRWVERGVNWRSSHLQLPYGDQAIFLKASTFHALGGFPELPIMEDFVFVRRLRKFGTIAIVPAAIMTSARRWQKLGIIKTTLTNQLIIAAYFLGVPPERIARWYRRERR
jgi:rSAM/selenodomain-associated transferase 2/rSAM/selenodomain-associated transferase 1